MIGGASDRPGQGGWGQVCNLSLRAGARGQCYEQGNYNGCL